MSTDDNLTPEQDDTSESGPGRTRWLRPRLLLPAVVVLLLASLGIATAVDHETRHSTATTGSAPTSAATGSASTSATPTATPTASSSTAASTAPPVTRPRTSAPAPHPSNATTSRASGNGSSQPSTPAPPINPGPAPVTSHTVHPTPTRSTPKPKPTPTAPPFKAHFVNVAKPAAFAGIPQGGAAQSGVIACVQRGECGGFGLQSGGSCSMPPYRGDTAGAQFSGWAMWEYQPSVCSWAMAVSDF